MRIADIKVEDVCSGVNWRVSDPNDLLLSETRALEDTRVEYCSRFSATDHVAYSCIFVLRDGMVAPLICIKEVGTPEYGGDYCEHVGGAWRQLGLVPNPDAPPGQEFFANPLDIDPSFDRMEEPPDSYRKYHRAGFAKWSRVEKR